MGSESSAFRSPIASCGAIGASVGGRGYEHCVYPEAHKPESTN